MNLKPILTFALLAAIVCAAGRVQAQVADERTFGNPLLSAGGASDMEDLGQVSGEERFVRGNREAGDFVGADTGDLPGFVGMQQGDVTAADVVSATESLRIEIAPDANQLQPQMYTSRTQMYPARLSLGSELTLSPKARVGARLAWQLSRSYLIRPLQPIEVSMEGRTATLRGTVSSEREKRLAECLARFEPGISTVKNDLVVEMPFPSPQATPRAEPSAAPGS